MSEALKVLPTPFYLSDLEKKDSRTLYEKVFYEDTKRFVDYYYQYKTKDNEILALKEDGQIVSMLHLNPYTMIVNGYEVESRYIVAVATHPDYRHRGYMRMLLERALRDLSAKKMPFTFLMPASEHIYAPYDFVRICPYTALPARIERMDKEGQNRYLASRYQLFCKRDVRYMENLEAEKVAERGEEPTEQMPPYMARITDVCGMLSLVGSIEERVWYLRIKDSILRENDGYFCWKLSGDESQATKLSSVPERVDLELTIGELASMVFGNFRICLSELV